MVPYSVAFLIVWILLLVIAKERGKRQVRPCNTIGICEIRVYINIITIIRTKCAEPVNSTAVTVLYITEAEVRIGRTDVVYLVVHISSLVVPEDTVYTVRIQR